MVLEERVTHIHKEEHCAEACVTEEKRMKEKLVEFGI